MPAGFANESAFDDLLRQAGQENGIDWLFLKAIVAQESGFNSQAYRAEPAHNDASYGLMQVLYATAQTLGYGGPASGLFDPAVNVKYGAGWAARQWRRYGGNPADAAAAYNAGTAYKNAAGQYTTKGGDPVVQNYVTRVVRYYAMYQADAMVGPPGAAPGDEASAADTTTPPVPEGNGSLFSDAEGALSGLWRLVTAPLAGSGWAWVPLAIAGALGVWLIYEVVT